MNHKGKDVDYDCLAGQRDERSVLGHAQKGDYPQIDTAQIPKRFKGRLALPEKIRQTIADSNPNNGRKTKHCQDQLHSIKVTQLEQYQNLSRAVTE